MQPARGEAPFDDPDYFFEPWWPGSRTMLFLERGEIRLVSEHMADPLRTFPELAAIARQSRADNLILDGTLMVLDPGGHPDSELLRRRLQGWDRTGGQPAYVATDLLHAEDRALTSRPFRERHDRLVTLLPDGDWCVVGRGYPREGRTVAQALAKMGLDAMSAKRLSARYVAGAAADEWLRLPLQPVETPAVRPTLTLIQRLPL